MARIIGLDYGDKRTGIAVTDPAQIIASGLTTVPTEDAVSFLKKYLEEEKVERFVLGQPRRLDNSLSEVESRILEFITELQQQFPDIPVSRQDERFTSKLAAQSLHLSGVKKKKRQQKELIDEVSATLILQAYLTRK